MIGVQVWNVADDPYLYAGFQESGKGFLSTLAGEKPLARGPGGMLRMAW
jgi:hypothetical protein